MKKIIILGTLIIVVIILLLSTISDNKSNYIKNTSKKVHFQDTLSNIVAHSIENNKNTILFDDFSDKDISDWNIDYQNATNWIYDFSDSTGIKVKDIINESFSNDLYGPWANIVLEKTIPINDSMVFISKIAWDSFNSNSTMQHLYFSFKDPNGKELLFFGYSDPYISYKGGILSKFYDQPYNLYKKRELPNKGNCFLKMIKNGEQIKLYYNNDILMQSKIVEDFDKLNIVFGYFPSINYKNSNLKSTFGELNVEFIKLLDYDDTQK